MIEDLRKTESYNLAVFAIWTFGVGAAIAGLGSLVCGSWAPQGPNDPAHLHEWRQVLQVSATSTALRFVSGIIVLWLFSFFVLQQACIRPRRADKGLVRQLARGVYLASIIAVVGALGAATFLIIIHG